MYQAKAYAQGRDIFIAPGQEHHLPHEAWHVVQQMQGRVKPTAIVNGVELNDDAELEREAEEMGIAVINTNQQKQYHNNIIESPNKFIAILQFHLVKDRLNVVGENHDESGNRRELEIRVCRAYTNSTNYWLEGEFKVDGIQGDAPILRLKHGTAIYQAQLNEYIEPAYVLHVNRLLQCLVPDLEGDMSEAQQYLPNADEVTQNMHELDIAIKRFFAKPLNLTQLVRVEGKHHPVYRGINENEYFQDIKTQINELCKKLGSSNDHFNLSMQRSINMHNFANQSYFKKGVWKIGDDHRKDIAQYSFGLNRQYNLVSIAEFNSIIEDYQKQLSDARIPRPASPKD
ncbi:hypothetical protein AGMMS49521_1870 [Campylobacterota bacterium]|nr:hypothetical protein AGMMS49521_1870 [Campylobacterota bacterium]